MKGAVASLLLCSFAAQAAEVPADDAHLHQVFVAKGTVDGETDTLLPPGYYITATGFSKLDTEIRRIQAEELALKAENTRLQEALADTTPAVKSVLLMFAAGLVTGGLATAWLINRGKK